MWVFNDRLSDKAVKTILRIGIFPMLFFAGIFIAGTIVYRDLVSVIFATVFSAVVVWLFIKNR